MTNKSTRFPYLENLQDFKDAEEILDKLLITFADFDQGREEAGSNDEDRSQCSTSSSTTSISVSKKEEDLIRTTLRHARDPANRSPLKDAQKACISFGGCGFLGSYQFGAAKMIYEHGSRLLERVDRYAGCSSGSLVATLLIFNPEKMADAVEEIYKMADEVNEAPLGAMTPGFIIGEKLRKVVERFIPEDVSKANNLLFVSVTKLKNWKNELISNFPNKAYLIDCLMASCYHPMYSTGLSGKAPCINGEPYIDGGYSNILPEFLDRRTVSVTAFAGDADICPAEKSALFNDLMFAFFNQNMKLTLSNVKRISNALFPPTRDILQQYCNAGAADAEKLLKENNMYN
ncbi:unnamed protein product [Caenorhabditis sp. 36 PRJEB53466]|nr:unnamed protein product [Caenorhabditis sp. 36 PRJEB53466]